MKIKLNRKQTEFVKSSDQMNVFVGGIGSGKTFAGAIKVLNKITIEGSFGLITAPVNTQLQNYTLKDILAIWEKLGIIHQEHYVINVKPPKEWNVTPYIVGSNYGILTTRWGSYAQIRSAHNFENFKGSQYDWIFIDEMSLLKKGAIELLLGRLRGEKFKELRLPHTLDAVTNPPHDISFIQNLQKSGVKIIQSKTEDNIDNLPPNYIELQKNILDERTYRREILGELIPPTLSIFYNYGEHNYSNLKFDPNKETVLSFDFNVNPMTCLVFQEHTAVKEFQIFESNTEDTCLKILDYLKSQNFRGRLYITGDPSGRNRSTQSPINNYTIIQNVFNEYNVSVRYPSRQSRPYGENCISSALKSYSGIVKLKINIDECKVLHKNLQIVTNEDYEKKDPNNITHNIDALRYYCLRYLPIKREL